MFNEKLYERYQGQLQEALCMDESATTTCKDGRGREAAELYDRAAALYAQAASTLLDASEDCTAAERLDIDKSVDRLIEVSRELKAFAASLRAQPAKEAPKGGAERAAAGDDSDDDVRFAPAGNIPDVTFDDIAGLDEAKQLVMEEIIHPLMYKDLYSRFRIESNGGLLLFGPPGSGKTMMARAIANKAQMPFFSVKCSDIVGKYFGEAEKHVRALFRVARKAHDAVVFLDEAEALACRRGGNSTVMNRLVPELLAQMDGFDRFDGRIIVVFATNRPYDIDPAFLRPGRLPSHCYVSLPDRDVRRAFLQKQLDERPCEGGIDVDALAAATDRFSCADLANLVKRASLKPVNRSIQRLESGQDAPEEFVRQADLDRALAALHPSVEPAEIKRLEKWMRQIGMELPDAV